MTSYRVAADGSLIDKATGQKFMGDGKVYAPMIIQDIEPYRSPITGEVIGGRAAQREDLKRNDCVLQADVKGESFGKRKGVKSEKWAKRLGLPLKGRDI
jgi:hypothetical protein